MLGLNLTFEPQRREAIAQAIATGRPAATPPLHIVTGKGPIGGFMSFLPVYRPGGIPGTPSGLVYGVFEIAPMVENVLKRTLRSNEVDVLFFDPAKHGEPIYWHPAASRTADLPRPTLAEAFALPHWAGTLDMAGQSWGVVLMTEHVAGGLWSRWSTLTATAVGLLLTALVDVYLLISRRHTVDLLKLTADLQATARSLTEKSERLSYLAHHDVLTGLPNRGSLIARLEGRLSDPAVSCVAVASLDLDGFKAINDTYGHAAGDALLVAVAARLRSAAGEDGFVARFGGDEFVLLCEPGAEGSAVDVLCRRAIDALSAPFDLLGIAMSVGRQHRRGARARRWDDAPGAPQERRFGPLQGQGGAARQLPPVRPAHRPVPAPRGGTMGGPRPRAHRRGVTPVTRGSLPARAATYVIRRMSPRDVAIHPAWR